MLRMEVFMATEKHILVTGTSTVSWKDAITRDHK